MGKEHALDYFEKRLDGEVKYTGVIVNVRLDRAELDNGAVVRREVVEHPGGVTILPVDREGNCYMVRQFRYPIGHMMLEAPAGKLEYGEDHRISAVREGLMMSSSFLRRLRLLSFMYHIPRPAICRQI